MQHPKGGRKCARRTPAAFIFICVRKQDDSRGRQENRLRALKKNSAGARKYNYEPSEILLRALRNTSASARRFQDRRPKWEKWA